MSEEEDILYTLPDEEMIPETMMLVHQLSDSRDWGHIPLNLEELHQKADGKDIKVAVLDTGCDLTHQDLKDRIIASKDFTGSRSGASDVAGHGTHCAGIISASINGVGLIGVAPNVSLYIGKVLSDNGSGYSSWIAAGIRWAIQQKVHIISMSLGTSVPDNIIGAAVKEAFAAGIHIVAAAGNSGPSDNTVGYPGGFTECICVAAINSSLKTAGFSSRGSQVDVAAPGVGIQSCYPGNRYATMSGTSMATPYVAGCLALYFSFLLKNGKTIPSPKEMFEIIEKTSRDLESIGRDNLTGWGMINPKTMFSNLVPPSPPIEDFIEISNAELLAKGIKKIRLSF